MGWHTPHELRWCMKGGTGAPVLLFRVHVPELADKLASDQVVATKLLEYGREQSEGQGGVDAGW